MSERMTGENLSGSGALSRITTTDVRNYIYIIITFSSLLIAGVAGWINLSSTVERISISLDKTIDFQNKLAEKINTMDSSGTVAFKSNVSETRSALNKLEALDARTIELLVKIQALDSSLNELKGFAGLSRKEK